MYFGCNLRISASLTIRWKLFALYVCMYDWNKSGQWARSIGILEVLLKINIKYLPARLGFYRFRKHFLKFSPRLGRSRSTARGQHGSSEMAQKDIRGALLYHILFSNKASFGTVVKWRKKTSEELCYITFFFPIKLHLGQSDHNIRFISKHQS